MTPTLETERLILRPLTLEDAPAAQNLFNNYEVIKYMFSKIPWPMPDDSCYTYYRDIALPAVETKGEHIWAVIEKTTGQFIGSLSLAPHDKQDSRGFWLGEPYWNKGYMTEAVTATTDYAFDVLKMSLMHLNNAAPNTGSRRMKEKAGATLVDTVEGEFVCGTLPKELWQLTPSQWHASPMKQQAKNPSYQILEI